MIFYYWSSQKRVVQRDGNCALGYASVDTNVIIGFWLRVWSLCGNFQHTVTGQGISHWEGSGVRVVRMSVVMVLKLLISDPVDSSWTLVLVPIYTRNEMFLGWLR